MRPFPILLVTTAILAGPALAGTGAYDPLAVASAGRIEDLTVQDSGRSREIPVRVYLPPSPGRAPVILFSHGLGGSRKAGSYLGKHWSARGFVAVFLQHPGSDTSVWQGKPIGQRMGAMNQAADLRNLLLRVEDVPVVLRQLGVWNRTGGHPLADRLDLSRVGMSGHSFGAITTQAVSGQTYALGGRRFTLPEIRAAVVFSPSGPRLGSPGKAFGSVTIPWLLMTGTRDVSPIGNIGLESRLAVFPALPPGGKYELVLDGAQHAAFGDTVGRGVVGGRNPNHHRAILALSTAFWETYLRDDGAARAWLEGAGPSSVLEPKDRWQKK